MPAVPMMPPFQDFGEVPGQRTSAAFLERAYQEIYAARATVAWPLEIQSGPSGDMIAIDRKTFDLIRCQLTSDLKSGQSATAYTLSGYPFDQGDEITIYDALGGNSGGVIARIGDYAICKWHPDLGRYEIIRSILQSGIEFFPAKLTSRTLSSGTYKYGWSECEFASKAALPTVLSGGQSGNDSSNQPAIELNNAAVAVNTFVWMRRGYRGARAVASLTKTQSGNNQGQAAAFSLYVDSANGGTYIVNFNGTDSAALAFNANAATVKGAIETAGGVTLSAFGGSGTLASPWTFSVTTDAQDYYAYADGAALTDDSSYAFAAPDGTSDLAEVGPKTTTYTASSGEDVICDISGGGFTVTLPALSGAKPIRISCIAYTLGGGNFVSVTPDGTEKINGITGTQVLADRGVSIGSDVNVGGSWLFRPSANSSIGWKCDRYLST